MKDKNTFETVVTLSNAAELVTVLAQGVLGNEVADTLHGSPLTRSVIYNQAMVRFQNAINQKVKGL